MRRDDFTLAGDSLVHEIRHAHFFCGLAGGAKGFNAANPRVGKMVGKFRCIGGIDVSPAAIADFNRLSGSRGTVLDLFDRSQYIAFNGHEPPIGWKEATVADIRSAFGNEHPHIIFLSAPCKGFSGLLNETKSKTDKYQALNRLTLRGVWLMLEAYKNDPVELIVFENVPRIATRGRHLLDQIVQLLQSYGYAVAETTHDCGELGALAQSRKRFLLVARHIEKVPPFLYEPEKKRLAGVGTLLNRMPLPGDAAAGPMHRIPRLQWQTWVRLAFVRAGSDWRSLNELAVENGVLRDYLIVPEGGQGGVSPDDPRFQASAGWNDGQQYGVLNWSDTCGAITGQKSPGQGKFSVADPRTGTKHNNCFRVVPFDSASPLITGGCGPSAGGLAVADLRRVGPTFGKYGVTPWNDATGTVISGSTTGQGAFAVADPRPDKISGREKGDHYLTGGHYGVVDWSHASGAVSASACHDNGHWSVADPRIAAMLPRASEHLVAIIRALDGTWHRPFTTLELAVLQSLVEPEESLELEGLSDSDWRERIGNAVPPAAAQAIAEVMGQTLLLAWSGETFSLSSTAIWVRPIAVGLALPDSSGIH